jgi:hypothetical protein
VGSAVKIMGYSQPNELLVRWVSYQYV